MGISLAEVGLHDNEQAPVSVISRFTQVLNGEQLTTSAGDINNINAICQQQTNPLSGYQIRRAGGTDILLALLYSKALLTVASGKPVINLFGTTVPDPVVWAKDPTDTYFSRLVNRDGQHDLTIAVNPSTDQVFGNYRIATMVLQYELIDILAHNLIIPVCKTAIDGTVGGGDTLADELAKSALMMKVL